MEKYLLPVAGTLLFLMAAVMGWQFVGVPLPVVAARTIGIAAIAGTAAFVGSALAWEEESKKPSPRKRG